MAAPQTKAWNPSSTHARSWTRDHPNLVFWTSWLLLNWLLFLPLYLLTWESTHFLPSIPAGSESLVASLGALVLWRENLDIFRFNLELVLLATLWVWIGDRMGPAMRRLFRWALAIFYCAALVYYLYEASALALFQVDPVFYAQAQLFTEGAQFVLRHLHIPPGVAALMIFGVSAGALAIVGLIKLGFKRVPVERLSAGTRIILALLSLLTIFLALSQPENLASPKMVVSSLAFKLQRNLSDSVAIYRRVVAFDQDAPQHTYNYAPNALLEKPDVYLIFVESYGSILYKRDAFRPSYEALLVDLDQQLAEEGWHTMSVLSESPTWGGGSWMAYTSALFGLRIDSHPQYLALLDRYQSETYPDLGQFFRNQGYHYARLTSLTMEISDTDWARYTQFFKADQWVQAKDLHYTGPGYGWGPAPADQYALNFAQETIAASNDKPLFFFWITQNSHYPWVPQPPLVDDWRTLNQARAVEPVSEAQLVLLKEKRKNYLQAIDYQLRFLTDFILKQGKEDSIFILIGDHQPQQVSRRADGWETPVHIISKDAAFLSSLSEYGFNEGLKVEEITPKMWHEGLYSLIARAMLANYGQGARVLPPYLPHGIVIDQPESTQGQ